MEKKKKQKERKHSKLKTLREFQTFLDFVGLFWTLNLKVHFKLRLKTLVCLVLGTRLKGVFLKNESEYLGWYRIEFDFDHY